MAQPNQLNPTTQNIVVFDGALAGGNAWSSKPIAKIEAYTNDVAAGVRQGLLNVNITRASTNALTTWDGNKDIGMKINAFNSAANGTNGGVEGIEILARNTGTGATCSIVKGLNITAENKTGAGTVQTMSTLMLTMKNNGVVATSIYGLEIQDDTRHQLQEQGTEFQEVDSLLKAMEFNPDLAILSRYQRERYVGENPRTGELWDTDEIEQDYHTHMALTPEVMKAIGDTKILHPLPRGPELPDDDDPRIVIWPQVKNAVWMTVTDYEYIFGVGPFEDAEAA